MWVVGGKCFSVKGQLLKQVGFVEKLYFLFQNKINQILQAGNLCRVSFTYLKLDMKGGYFHATLMALLY